jgi:hypothetical protein
MVKSHLDGWETNTLNTPQVKLNITMDGETCTTLMIVWLSITNQV